MKKCNSCGKEKPLQDFSKSSTNKDGLQYTCKSCQSAYSSIRNKNNRPLINEQEKKRYALNPDKTKASVKIWAENNKEKVRTSDKAKRKAKPDKYKILSLASARKYQISKVTRCPKWVTKSSFIEMRWAYQIAAERTKETGVKYEVDHIVPLQGKNVSGLHVPWNLQVIPAIENRSKGNR